jgi:hypothetical protein
VFRDFITELLETQGVEVPGRNMPVWLARSSAVACERIWRTLRLKGQPPVKRLAVWLSSLETTIDISRALSELGYDPVRTITHGMSELRQEHHVGTPTASEAANPSRQLG